jgi:quinol monooxygenase YgiN
MTTVTKGLWVPLEAKPGKEEDVARFLESGRSLVDEEPDTIAWFAVRLGTSQFAIFDVFPDDSGRQAHLSGRVAEALMAQSDELLARPPEIQQTDVVASKLPAPEAD